MKKVSVVFCDGSYRTDKFENLYREDLVASVGFEPKGPNECLYKCATCEHGAT